MSDVRDEMDRVVHDGNEGLSEEEVISHSRHRRRLHWTLLCRNTAVALAALLFIL